MVEKTQGVEESQDVVKHKVSLKSQGVAKKQVVGNQATLELEKAKAQ